MKPPALPRSMVFGRPACRGWLHGADAPGLPVLLCGPVGAEDLSSHAVLRQVADALAAAGQPCLRFDMPGCGEGAPLARQADAVPRWIESVHAAIDVLRAATGAPRVAVLGLRLGATLAALAAATRVDVAAFVAWVPVIAGRGLLREWKLLGAAGLPSLVHDDGSLETGGFLFNAPTCAGLGALSLTSPLVRPAPRVLVIDRDDLPVAHAWACAMEAVAKVETVRLPGYDGLMAVPHLVRTPTQMRDRAVQWLQAMEGRLPAVPRAVPTPATATVTRLPAAALALTVDGCDVVERPVWLTAGSGDEPPLCAVVTAPSLKPPSGAAVLVLNTGAERRVGPHGQFVASARHWAAGGALVMRLDLAGLGDSGARTGEEPPRVYSPQALADVRRAVAWLRAQPGVRRVVALGLCSGAFHAVEALAEGRVVDGAVAINPLLFFRPEREDFDAAPAQAHAVQQLSGQAWRHLRDPGRWRKLLTGQADVAFLAGLVGRRAALALRRLGRSLSGAGASSLPAKLRRAAPPIVPGQPARLCFVFADHDAGLALLQADAGAAWRSLTARGRIEVHCVADADHTFSRAEARDRLAAVLDGVLQRWAAAVPPPHATVATTVVEPATRCEASTIAVAR